MKKVEKYDVFEISVDNIKPSGLVEDGAVFKNGEDRKHVPAFKNGIGKYTVRFMPDNEGIWDYQISLGNKEIHGEFECIGNTGNNHGKVVTRGFHFQYADGTKYIPIGTTCYAWIHQSEELQKQTLSTLSGAPFNKVRMCIFPKSMPYNSNDPFCYPFSKKEESFWDVSSPDPKFWNNLDRRIEELMELGIEADLILFHPYDRWGFAELTQEESLTYLEYCIARLSAYRNIWWSLANEYELMYGKTFDDWNEYGKMLMEKDLYNHLVSIHNITLPYQKRKWMTHCSIQSGELNKIATWKKKYQLPVIIDECGYEGDLPYGWGSLSAFEMVHRFWWTTCKGGFCTHGETFHREDEVLWWAKGGKLYGESAARIAFLKELLYSLPGNWSTSEHIVENPNINEMNEEALHQHHLFKELLDLIPEDERENFMANTSPMMIKGDGYYLEYLGRLCPVYTELKFREDRKYRVEIIDSWEMTRSLAAEGICGAVKIGLPAKEGIAILVTDMDRGSNYYEI